MSLDEQQQLKLLLGQIYSAGQKPAVDEQLFTSDDFRIYCYKVIPCSKRNPHDWTDCPFCHPGEKATRRCPQKYQYTAVACPDMKKTGECARGETCMLAHNVFEYWLHPSRYRTQMCSYGLDCKRSICFFAHHYGELRTVEQQAQLQALERELDVGEGFGFPGMGNRASHHFANNAANNAAAQLLQLQLEQEQQRQAAASLISAADVLQQVKIRQLQQALAAKPTVGTATPNLLHAALTNLMASASSAHSAAPASSTAMNLLGSGGAAGGGQLPMTSGPLGTASPLLSPVSTLLDPLPNLLTSLPSLVAPAPTLLSPVPSLTQADDTMATTMKLLAELTTKPRGGSGTTPAAAAPPAPPPAAPSSKASNQTTELIARLKELTAELGATFGAAEVPAAAPAVAYPPVPTPAPAAPPAASPAALDAAGGNKADLHAALLALLPHVLKQLGTPNPAGAEAVQSPLSASLAPSTPQLFKAPPSCSSTPVDVLSLHSEKLNCSSSISASETDGTRSPPMSQIEDDDETHLGSSGPLAANGVLGALCQLVDGPNHPNPLSSIEGLDAQLRKLMASTHAVPMSHRDLLPESLGL